MKRLTLFSLVFFLLFSLKTFAHTGLETSSPQDGDIITEALEQITLTFETKIEQGSTFELNNSIGETIAVDKITLSENQLNGQLAKPLENGEYTIQWNIIGADGHPIDGILNFSVNLPMTEETPAEQEPESLEEEIEYRTQVEENETEENRIILAEETEENETSYLVPTIIGILILIAIISLLMMRRKK